MSTQSQSWKSNWNLVKEKVEQYHLLKHPFYQAWSKGQLPKEALRTYAAQYYRHVAAFPTYLSALHARAEEGRERRVILENLVDEEYKTPTHPELWLRFAEGLGLKRSEVEGAPAWRETGRVVSAFRRVCSQRPLPEGIALLYAYEDMTPRVAATKAKGLDEFYGIRSERAVRYFTLHEKLDRRHAAQWKRVLAKPLAEKKQAQAAAQAVEEGMQSIWNLLTTVLERSGAGKSACMN